MAAGTLAGCGGATKTVIVQGPPSQTTPATATATTPASGTSTTSATTTSAAPAGEAPSKFVRLEAFQTPSGNIGCMIVGGLARCDIVRRSWQLPPRPSSCPQIVDFGQGLEVGSTGTGRFVCAGDTARDPTSPKLQYGTASRVGSFLCVSRTTGMTCTNSTSGHGFALSIQRYQLF